MLTSADFVRSPTHMSPNMSQQLPARGRAPHDTTHQQRQEPEPLLSLLTTSHPWLGGTINGSLSAYTSTKSYSPRFIQYGADFVERNIGSPVANTVGSVGRRTGVEGSLRRYLGARRPSDLDGDDDGERSKRRRVMDADPDSMDIEKGFGSRSPRSRSSRRQSQISFAESLPAYDDNRSPVYEEHLSSIAIADEQSRDRSTAATGTGSSHAPRTVSWSTQLMITTSGLGAALSEGSLRSLKFCLSFLRSATSHIGNVMRALRMVLDDYDRVAAEGRQNGSNTDASEQPRPADTNLANTDTNKTNDPERDARRLAERIKALSDDILQTLKTVVSSVSRYTGGALPENASALVRRQLMSVPQRWRLASRSTASGGGGGASDEAARGAHRMLAFAKEGLDMMAQVSSIVDCTIVSAEQWLDSLGRRRRAETEGGGGREGVDEKERDRKMVDAGDEGMSPRTTAAAEMMVVGSEKVGL